MRRKLLVVLSLVNQTPPDRRLLTCRVTCRQELGVEKHILPQWKSMHWEEGSSATATLCLFSNVFDVCLSSASFCTSKYLYCTGVWLTLLLQKWNSCYKIPFWANFKTYVKFSHYMVMVCTYGTCHNKVSLERSYERPFPFLPYARTRSCQTPVCVVFGRPYHLYARWQSTPVFVCIWIAQTHSVIQHMYVHTSQAFMCKCTHTHFSTHNGEVRNKWICFFRNILLPNKL